MKVENEKIVRWILLYEYLSEIIVLAGGQIVGKVRWILLYEYSSEIIVSAGGQIVGKISQNLAILKYDFAYIKEPLACIENGVLMHGCGKTPLLIFESNHMSIHKTVFQHIMKTLKLTHIYISSVSTTEILNSAI